MALFIPACGLAVGAYYMAKNYNSKQEELSQRLKALDLPFGPTQVRQSYEADYANAHISKDQIESSQKSHDLLGVPFYHYKLKGSNAIVTSYNPAFGK